MLPRYNYGVVGKIKSDVVLWGFIKLGQGMALLIAFGVLAMVNGMLFSNTTIGWLQWTFDVLGLLLTVYLIMPSRSNPEKLNCVLLLHDFKRQDKNFVSINSQPYSDINLKIQFHEPDNYAEINKQLQLQHSDLDIDISEDIDNKI